MPTFVQVAKDGKDLFLGQRCNGLCFLVDTQARGFFMYILLKDFCICRVST